MARSLLILFFSMISLSCFAHCQMPCGIYNDAMIYDKIDEYVETMVKAIFKIRDNKFSSPFERNELVRWVMTKDRMSDEAAEIITSYFLQQKIKPGEKDTLKYIESAHKLLFLIVTIKQTTDFQALSSFAEEWDRFKLMFHIEDYDCRMTTRKMKELMERQQKLYEEEKKGAAQP